MNAIAHQRITQPGIYDAIPMHQYINDPCLTPSLSTGVIETIYHRSVLHARAEHPRYGGMRDEGAKAADEGSAIHKLALGDDRALVWVDADSYSTKAARAVRDAAHASGNIPILCVDQERITNAGEVARETLLKLGGGSFEQTLIWQEDDVWNRARPDYIVTQQFVWDLKTCDNAEPANWARTAMTAGGYDSQGAHVLAGVRALLGEDRHFGFVVVEKHYPFEVSLVGLSPDRAAYGAAKRAIALRKWKQAQETRQWPGYPTSIYWADLPKYLKSELEKRSA